MSDASESVSVVICEKEKSVTFVDCTADSPPECGLSPVRCPRHVIDCTTPPETPDAKKRVRDGDKVCPDAPKKARAIKQMMESPFAKHVCAIQLIPPPISVRLICMDDGTVKVVFSYNRGW